MLTAFGYILTGLAAGFFGGLLGVGGGFLKVPILTLVFGMHMHAARAVSLVSNVFIAAVAAQRYRRKKMIVFPIVFRIFGWAMGAALLGVMLGDVLSEQVTKRIFALFILWVFIDILRPRRQTIDKPGSSKKRGMAKEASVGASMGFMAGLLGIGGGVIAVPLGRRVLGLPMKNAVACSVALIIPSSFVAAVLCMYNGVQMGHFSWSEPLLVCLYLVPSSMVGAQLGAYTSMRIRADYLRYIFAAIQPIIFFKMWFG
jgi:uncharacterized membrane protein YfcA